MTILYFLIKGQIFDGLFKIKTVCLFHMSQDTGHFLIAIITKQTYYFDRFVIPIRPRTFLILIFAITIFHVTICFRISLQKSKNYIPEVLIFFILNQIHYLVLFPSPFWLQIIDYIKFIVRFIVRIYAFVKFFSHMLL